MSLPIAIYSQIHFEKSALSPAILAGTKQLVVNDMPTMDSVCQIAQQARLWRYVMNASIHFPVESRNAAQRAADYVRSRLGLVFTFLVAGLIVFALYFGWTHRSDEYLTAESGLGYALGIIGASMMLVLLLYPMRKRIRALKWMGSVSGVFRIHMLLGLFGPLAILFHANFGFGALNSAVAMTCMLIVVASGVIGRYLYSRIHMGLYGRKAEVRELIADAETFLSALQHDLSEGQCITSGLRQFEARVHAAQSSFLRSTGAVVTLGVATRSARIRFGSQIRKDIGITARASGWDAVTEKQHLREARVNLKLFFKAIRQAAEYTFYERLFSLWHVLHLPLFVLLGLTAVIHVIAVHLY